MAERIITESDLFEIEAPRLERGHYEMWPDQYGFEQSVPIGPLRYAPMKLTINTSVLSIFMHRFNTGDLLRFNIHGFTFKGYVTEVMVPCDGLPVASVRISGPVVQLAKEEKKMRKTKVLNRFYVASDKMISEAEQGTVNTGEQRVSHDGYNDRPRHTRWAKRDLAQAIDHARQILDNDPSKHEVAIVRIVKMVRRKATPVIVEDVR